ncbi:MAG TPA: GTPase [Thermoplasmatales archaeon]|nr:GTPase [Thermoplasmatales archaeon]
MKIFVLGPAGCGKSSFVKSFSEYLRDMSEDVRCVNLDPATDPVFKAEKDVRSFVKTEEVMKKYGLGINGGLLKSMDEVLFYVKDLDVSGDYVICDTPGQMEIFIYSSSGRRIIEKLSDKTTAGLFLMDSSLVTDPESFLSAVMQNVIVSLRLSIPTATVLTKNDVVDVDVREMVKKISSKNSVLAELLEKTSYFLEYTSLSQRVVKVSSLSKNGFDDVYSLLNEMFCSCGDLS